MASSRCSWETFPKMANAGVRKPLARDVKLWRLPLCYGKGRRMAQSASSLSWNVSNLRGLQLPSMAGSVPPTGFSALAGEGS